MRPKRFSGLTLIRNSQNQIFGSQEYVRTETIEDLYDLRGYKNSQDHLRSTLPEFEPYFLNSFFIYKFKSCLAFGVDLENGITLTGLNSS